MRKALFTSVFIGALMLPLVAHADTIDDFLLTGEGNIITFSLPASPAVNASIGAGNVLGGYFVNGGALVTVNGVSSSSSMEFFSGRLSYLGGADLTFTADGTTYTTIGPVLYTDAADDFTFKTGTFSLRNFYGVGDPYSLSITPESSIPPAVPEPSTLLLLTTGIAGFFCLANRNRRPSNSCF